MATVIDSTALFFGAPASLTVGGTEVGATITAPKCVIESEQYAPDFQGAGGPVSGAVFITKIRASVEFDVNELTATKIAWSLPGSSAVVGTGTPAGGGASTTLSADAAAGATQIVVTAATSIAANDFLKIGDTGETEIRQVTSGYVSGTTIPLTQPLVRAHDSGDAVVETVDAGTTITTWSIGRVPANAFKDVVLDGVGLDGRHLKVTVSDALSDGKLEIEMSDSAVAGSHVVMTGFYDGASPALAPVQIEVG
jgi:hypothetical protein